MSTAQKVDGTDRGPSEDRRPVEPEASVLHEFREVQAALGRWPQADGIEGWWPPENLTMQQFKVLMLLVRPWWPEHHADPWETIGSLAHHFGVSAPSMSGIVERLCRAGLVERHRSQPDRRVVHLVATAHGRAVVEELFSARVQRLRHYLSLMSRSEIEALFVGLRAVRLAVARDLEREAREAAFREDLNANGASEATADR